MRMLGALTIAVLAAVSPVVQAASPAMVLNEWNCVGDDKKLANNGSDPIFGQHDGNGGNWIELVVVEDDLDIRGWVLEWQNDDEAGNHGTVDFVTIYEESENADTYLSEIPAGTTITIMEGEEGSQDFGQGSWGDASDLDISANRIHILLSDDSVVHHSGALKVDNDGWRMRILKPTDPEDETPSFPADYTVVQSWVGEDIAPGWSGSAINSQEVGYLTADPTVTDISAGNYYQDNDSSTFGTP